MLHEAIRFERPLRDVRLVAAGQGRLSPAGEAALAFTAERERVAAAIAAARETGYWQGRADAEAALAEELRLQRQESLGLAEGALRRLSDQRAALEAQTWAGLPGLVMNIVRRVLAGCDSNAGQVQRLIEQALAEIPPGNDRPMEVFLSPADLVLLENMHGAALREKHPCVVLRADPTLAPNDCLVRGNFGLFDGRLETRLKTVESLLEPH